MAGQSKTRVDDQIRVRPMTATNRTDAARRQVTTYWPGGWYVPGVAVVAAIVTTATLLSVLPGSAITGWTLTTDGTPLVAAGGPSVPVVGFVQFGLVRVYVSLLAILLVIAGEVAAVSLGRLGIVLALAGGVGAGTQLVVVSGCGCGDGTAGQAMTLLEQAMAIGLV